MSKKGDFKDISGKAVDLTAMFTNPDVIANISLRTISGFWHRIFALVIDGIILAATGTIIGVALGDRAYALGPWGLLLGFIISIAYFGILNSHLGKGQTVGKKLLNIQVVTADGHKLPLSKSCLRALLLVAPLFIIQYPYSPALLTFVAAIMWISLFYFYLINHQKSINLPTGQTYYDLLLGSYVVNKKPEGIVKTVSFWKGHFVIVGFILLLIYSGSWYWYDMQGKTAFYTQLLQTEGVYKATTSELIYMNDNSTTPNTTVGVVVTKVGVPNFDASVFDQIVKVVLAYYPKVEHKNQLYIDLKYEYNIGFMRWYRNDTIEMSPMKWKDRLLRQP